MTLPTFICIGAQRAGTTWLHRMLSAHPGVFMTAQKELHFFDEQPDFSGYEGLGRPGRQRYYDMEAEADWRWYREQFAPGAGCAVRGEITPFYATLSRERVALMAGALPGVKIVYILRNPVLRAWSGFRLFWFLQSGNRECALDAETIRKTVMHPAKLVHGDYRRNIEVYESCFERERILYLFYDDIVARPAQVLREVADFLEVGPWEGAAAGLAGRVNSAPDAQLPASVREALAAHYAEQAAFIARRFNRVLER